MVDLVEPACGGACGRLAGTSCGTDEASRIRIWPHLSPGSVIIWNSQSKPRRGHNSGLMSRRRDVSFSGTATPEAINSPRASLFTSNSVIRERSLRASSERGSSGPSKMIRGMSYSASSRYLFHSSLGVQRSIASQIGIPQSSGCRPGIGAIPNGSLPSVVLELWHRQRAMSKPLSPHLICSAVRP
jgi:hypothetical protein